MYNERNENLASLWVKEAKRRRDDGLGGVIVFPESTEPRTLSAIVRLCDAGAARRVVLLGERKASLAAAETVDGDLRGQLERHAQGTAIEWTGDSIPELQRITHQVLEVAAAAKGKTLDPARHEAMSMAPLYQAGALVRSGHATCALAGAASTTADVIRAALATVGLADGVRTASGSFIMEREGSDDPQALLFADSGVVVEPDPDQLVDIAAASVSTWEALVPQCGFTASGTEPVVAFLSFSTKGSAGHPSATRIAEAAAMFRKKFPHIRTDGELQFDAATVPGIAQRKCPSSPVAGQANILVFPDLNSGNIAYKITQRLAGFNACGPILQGLAQPYSDLSRGSTPHDIFLSALACLLRG
ncbi:MAG: phosphate acetyltransferase [Pseudomonadota bacterium]